MPETINNYHRKNEKLQFVKSLITDKIFMLKCFFEVAVSRDFLAFYFLFYESNLNGPLINSAVLACEESLREYLPENETFSKTILACGLVS